MKKEYEPYTRFKLFLEGKGVTQGELARLLGKSRTAVNLKLNGRGSDFSGTDIRIICREFNISADDFFIDQKVSQVKQRAVR